MTSAERQTSDAVADRVGRWSLVEGLRMITGPGAALSAEPTDSVSLLRLLAEATDTRAFLATLRTALPRLLPATRVDLLTNDRPDGEHLSLAWGGEVEPPPHAVRSAANFGESLASRGYATVSTLPLTGAGQHLGWLALARQRKPLGPGALALAGQLVAMIALRLLYERCRDDLASRDEQA